MPVINSLIEFENHRRKINSVPPKNSNAFFNIGKGTINIFSIRDNPDNYRFDLSIDKGSIYTGYGVFNISGDIVDINNPYKNLTITRNSSFYITQMLECSKGEIKDYGNLILQRGAKLVVKDNATVVISPTATITFENDSEIIVENGSHVVIYGLVNIHINELTKLRESKNIVLDSAAVLNVYGINTPVRIFSLTDYMLEMHGQYININTQGERNFEGGRIGYIWKGGSPHQPSQMIELIAMYGRVVLGDFRLSILGEPEEIIPEMQVIKNLVIRKRATLYLTTKIEGYKYYYPELYLGRIIGNSKLPSDCVVEGKIIAETDSTITIDRESTLRILPEGEVHLKSNSIMRSTHNLDREVLFIEGRLYIDSIEQLVGFRKENIVFGENGKLIIVNPPKLKSRILLSIPNGIQSSLLYQLFRDRLDKVEFHVSGRTGIEIDEYKDSYALELKDWYGGMRLEQAIKEKYIIWEDGAFLQLNHDTTNWISESSTLLVLGRIFRSFGSNDKERLQDVVNRLKSINCGNMRFRFGTGTRYRELRLKLNGIKMLAAYNDPTSKKYNLLTDNSGTLFIRNKIGISEPENIINSKSRSIKIPNSKRLEFLL